MTAATAPSDLVRCRPGWHDIPRADALRCRSRKPAGHCGRSWQYICRQCASFRLTRTDMQIVTAEEHAVIAAAEADDRRLMINARNRVGELARRILREAAQSGCASYQESADTKRAWACRQLVRDGKLREMKRVHGMVYLEFVRASTNGADAESPDDGEKQHDA